MVQKEKTGITEPPDVSVYEEQKVTLLRQYGFPKTELWLTEVTSSQDAIDFYGEDSEIAEIIHQEGDKPFVLYYHESGTVHFVASFSDQAEFVAGCERLAAFFAP